MIRDVCIHVTNEQPLVVDLFDLPSASDAGLLCTNVRTLDGKRPVYIDSSAATFFFPYHIVRFLEIPEGALERGRTEDGAAAAAAGADHPGDADHAGPARPGRPAATVPANRLPALVGHGSAEVDDSLPEPDLEIDEDFLRRIRDI